MLFKIEKNLDYIRKNKLICLKYYIFLNKLFKQKTPKSYEIGVFYALVARFCSLLYCFLWLGWQLRKTYN